MQLLLIVALAVAGLEAVPQYPPYNRYYPQQQQPAYYQQPYQPYYYHQQQEEAYPYYFHRQPAPSAPVPFRPVKYQQFMPAYNRQAGFYYYQPQKQQQTQAELLPGDYIKFLGTVKNQQQQPVEDDTQCDEEEAVDNPLPVV